MLIDGAPLPLQPNPAVLLAEQGIDAVFASTEAVLESIRADSPPQVVLVDTSVMSHSDLRHFVLRCSQMKLPVIALVPGHQLSDMDAGLGVSDFVVTPPNPAELVTRARHALWRTRSQEGADVIRVGDLVIDPTSYEVSLKGRRIDLRFKEYELLRLMAANPGRVYSREALLNQVWGYDYFGGTRTVDVHIRRLRSKIEDADHSFIDTIWQVGYRFRDPSHRTTT